MILKLQIFWTISWNIKKKLNFSSSDNFYLKKNEADLGQLEQTDLSYIWFSKRFSQISAKFETKISKTKELLAKFFAN